MSNTIAKPKLQLEGIVLTENNSGIVVDVVVLDFRTAMNSFLSEVEKQDHCSMRQFDYCCAYSIRDIRALLDDLDANYNTIKAKMGPLVYCKKGLGDKNLKFIGSFLFSYRQ